MFKDGKIFGKLNVIDFIVIAIIALLIIGTVFKFSNFSSTSEEGSIKERIGCLIWHTQVNIMIQLKLMNTT